MRHDYGLSPKRLLPRDKGGGGVRRIPHSTGAFSDTTSQTRRKSSTPQFNPRHVGSLMITRRSVRLLKKKITVSDFFFYFTQIDRIE